MTAIWAREDWAPKGSAKVVDETTGAEMYLFNTLDGKPAAMAFSGKRSKPDWRYQFFSEKHREKHIEDYLAGLAEYARRKAEMKAERKAHQTSLKAGSILVASWGYDQTNVDWYQVVEVKASGKTVVIRKIAGKLTNGEEGFMCGHSVPIPDKFKSEPMVKRAQTTGRGEYITIDESRTAFVWDGKPEYVSWYA